MREVAKPEMTACLAGCGLYLYFRNDGPSLRTRACECCQRRWRDHGIGSGKVAEVAAWNVVLFVPHDDGFYDEKAVPR